MKFIFALLLILPAFAIAQNNLPDTTAISKTKLFSALNTGNAFCKREQYEVRTKQLDFKAIIFNSLTTKTIIKGCSMFATNFGRSSVVVYFDENEIDDIISTLQYIKTNVNLEEKPDHDIWIYYKTADNFEVGSKADKGKKYEIYFHKNHIFRPDDEVTMNRNDLDEIYDSFVSVKNFLKSH